jgi:4,5:9,10-diseco-3-hydroxy-5,9,17-trioxoandrosta-1(10),2-diene-4-oate hydrolase
MVARSSYELKNAFGYTQTGRLTYENTEKYIDIKGVKIHFHEAGEDHADTIVFLHGGGLGASGWFNFYLNIEPFAEHFRTILIDMPNFGKSDALRPQARDGIGYDSDILSEFLRLKGIERASLMGNSKGGADAIRFSVDHTDQLDLNILMGAATGPSIMDVMPPQGTALLGDILRDPARDKVEKLLHLFVYDDSFVNEEWINLRMQGVEESEKRGHRAARLEPIAGTVIGGDNNLTSRLNRVPNPTLVVFGAHDRFAAMDSSISLLRHYPNAELHVFRNSGHWVQFELSEEFNELVINWMKQQKRKQAKGG